MSFTRARSKLIIFGSRKTLKAVPMLKDFFSLMEDREWIYTLSPAADGIHELFSQTYPKRAAEDMDILLATETRPAKKTRTPAATDEALSKGRHILKDLFNAQK